MPFTMRSTLRLLVMTLLGAFVVASCAGSESDRASESLPTTGLADSSDTDSESSTTQYGTLAVDEVPMDEFLDPIGEVASGNAGPSYVDANYPAELDAIVELAKIDLADLVPTDVSTINVVLVEEVVWSDASLGCPDPDRSFAQVPTDGLRIVLEAGGILFDYRSGGFSDPILCVQAVDKDETRAGIFNVNEDGEIDYEPPTTTEEETPTEGINPPDK